VSSSMRDLIMGFAATLTLVAATNGLARELPLPAGAEVRVVATAYCHRGATQSGEHTRSGVIAADPHVLESGSLVRILNGPRHGVYTVRDTGATVKGFTIDIFIDDCRQAEAFGKRPMRLRVLRRGPGHRRAGVREWRGSIGD
jgi:3D (Asp-Asp-Asp) domain-containing protein